MKTPKFLNKLSAVLSPRPRKVLKATARTARPAIDDYDAEEPTTKLSSAFIVVLILHVVAVGGIYAFNSIKASRRGREEPAKSVDAAASTVTKTASTEAPASAALAANATPARKVETTASAAIAANTKPAGRTYEVKAGDNLTKIAFAFNAPSADIMTANQLKEGALLRPGQVLTIPAAKTPAKPVIETAKTTPKVTDIPPTKTTPGLYTVKKGDTLTSIARSFGLTPAELTKVNKVIDPKKLQLGQVLKVPPRKS
jgi:LysM repeat protein